MVLLTQTQTTVALAAALALAAATAPTPASANLWGDLASLDAKKAAIDARIDEKLEAFRNVSRSKFEHDADAFEAKLDKDKEAQAKGLEVKLANLTAFKARVAEGKAAAKADADAKFWHAFNKTGDLHAAKVGAVEKLANKSMAHEDKAALDWAAFKNATEAAKDAAEAKVAAKVEGLAKAASEKAVAVEEKIANKSAAVAAKLEKSSAAKAVSLCWFDGNGPERERERAGWRVGDGQGWRDLTRTLSLLQHTQNSPP